MGEADEHLFSREERSFDSEGASIQILLRGSRVWKDVRRDRIPLVLDEHCTAFYIQNAVHQYTGKVLTSPTTTSSCTPEH